MPGPVPGIPIDERSALQIEMAGTSPAMTRETNAKDDLLEVADRLARL